LKILTLSVFAAALIFGGGQALAASTQHAATKTLTVYMHDPGCHWFKVDGKFTKTASVAGPVRLKDLDAAPLKIASKAGMRHIAVGNSIVLSHGNYVIMMVGQASDDNYLKLTVR
jgi:hypothetical protein